MFKLNLSDSYFWPVTIQLPTDGGKMEKHTFDVQFKRLPQSDVVKLVDRVSEREATFVDVSKEIVVGWKGIQEPDGTELVFSDSALAKVLEISGMGSAIAQAFLDSARGLKVKN